MQVISQLLMNHRTSYLRTANCGILADEFRTLIRLRSADKRLSVNPERTRSVSHNQLITLVYLDLQDQLIPLVYGCHENSNKNGKADAAKIWAFWSHLHCSVLFLSKNMIYFNIPQATATNCRRIKNDEVYVKFLLRYQDAGNEAMEFDSRSMIHRVCVPQTPRRTDLSYMNPQVEDSHPFPLIVSELASGHEKNVFPSPPA
ncbi:hypothetical protein T03_3887 [Trichinella britovi]|uniref:Uncharacterized protein n=1 Tax=Trichinella britovi TaxID=45882 RepID=A0A0V1C4K1_TRIBR|nr:hypothetical protein T03_823 [Trichinella britovi]KRY45363.1 hypothetical protein T03_3887 [Trichinella britovi]